MSGVKNFDRDLSWAALDVDSPTWPNANVWPGTFYPNYTSLAEKMAMMRRVSVGAVSIATNASHAQACLIEGPDSTEGSVYRIKGHAWTAAALKIQAFMAIAPAAPANFVAVDWQHQIKTASQHLEIDETIYIPSFGTVDSVDFSGRQLAVGFAFINDTAGSLSGTIQHFMSVQRLVVRPPSYKAAMR